MDVGAWAWGGPFGRFIIICEGWCGGGGAAACLEGGWGIVDGFGLGGEFVIFIVIIIVIDIVIVFRNLGSLVPVKAAVLFLACVWRYNPSYQFKAWRC